MKDNLPHDVYEQFIRLFVAQEGRLRAFLRTLVPSLDDLDEVMQETSPVAWRIRTMSQICFVVDLLKRLPQRTLVILAVLLPASALPLRAEITRDDVLSIRDGRFFLDGRPFAEISFDKFDLLWQLYGELAAGRTLDAAN